MKRKLYKKKISILLSTAMVLGSMPINTAMAQDNLEIFQEKQSDVQTVSIKVDPEITYEKDGTFYADIMLENNQGINSYTFYLDYNPDVIQAVKLNDTDSPDIEEMVNYTYKHEDTNTGEIVDRTSPMILSNLLYAQQLNMKPTQNNEDYKEFPKADGTVTASELGRIKMSYLINHADANDELIEATKDGILMRFKFKMVGTGTSDIKITGLGNGFDAKPTDYLKLKTEYVNATVNVKNSDGTTETTTEATTTDGTTETTTEATTTDGTTETTTEATTTDGTTETTTQAPTTDGTTETTTEATTTDGTTETTTQAPVGEVINYDFDTEMVIGTEKGETPYYTVTDNKFSDANRVTIVNGEAFVEDTEAVATTTFVVPFPTQNSGIVEISADITPTTKNNSWTLMQLHNGSEEVCAVRTDSGNYGLRIEGGSIAASTGVAVAANTKVNAKFTIDFDTKKVKLSVDGNETAEFDLGEKGTEVNSIKFVTAKAERSIYVDNVIVKNNQGSTETTTETTTTEITTETTTEATTSDGTTETTTQAPPESAIKYEDEEFGKAVKAQIGDIDTVGAAKIEELNLSDAEISKLNDLKYFPNLKTLNLSKNDIKDITPIENLKSVQTLDLSDNIIRNVSSLSALTTIKELYINDNRVNDLSSITTLVNLEKLNFSNTYIKDISKVASLTNLKYLVADENDINDISAIASLGNLEEVSLSDNNIINIDALKDLAKLKEVDISDNNIDLEAGSSAKEIYDALVGRNVTIKSDSKPITITSDVLLNAVKEVLARLGITVEDGKPITKESAKQVEKLDLKEKQLNDSNINDLSEFNNVKEIDLSSNNITDIGVIKNMKKLSKIDVSNNNISDISVLVKLADSDDVTLMEAGGITELNFANNAITDISPLLQITTLEKVNITGNNLDLSSYLTEDMNIIRTLKDKGITVIADDMPVFGDADGNGTVDAADAAMVLERVLNGNEKLDNEDIVKFTNEKIIIANDAKEVLIRVLSPDVNK